MYMCVHAVGTLCGREGEVTLVSPVVNMKCRKTLKGHRGKILHFDWSPDKCHIITSGQVRPETRPLANTVLWRRLPSRMAMLSSGMD